MFQLYRPANFAGRKVVSKVYEENIQAIATALEVACRLGIKLNYHNIFLINLRNNLSTQPVVYN